LNKEVTVRFGKLKMQLWDSMCWPHVNPVPSGAVGKDCQRRLLSRPRFVRACSSTDLFIVHGCDTRCLSDRLMTFCNSTRLAIAEWRGGNGVVGGGRPLLPRQVDHEEVSRSLPNSKQHWQPLVRTTQQPSAVGLCDLDRLSLYKRHGWGALDLRGFK
jgi:hypothetical protein